MSVYGKEKWDGVKRAAFNQEYLWTQAMDCERLKVDDAAFEKGASVQSFNASQ